MHGARHEAAPAPLDTSSIQCLVVQDSLSKWENSSISFSQTVTVRKPSEKFQSFHSPLFLWTDRSFLYSKSKKGFWWRWFSESWNCPENSWSFPDWIRRVEIDRKGWSHCEVATTWHIFTKKTQKRNKHNDGVHIERIDNKCFCRYLLKFIIIPI